MSRIRPWTNGDQVALESGRVPMNGILYDPSDNIINFDAGRVPVSMSLTDSANIDAFARLRVSNPQAIFDNVFQYNLNPTKFSNSLTGAASITHVPEKSAAELSTGGTTLGDKAILQTRRYMRYQPGKSQLILMTATLGDAKANVRQRLGYFDDSNGLFFEQDSTAKKVILRTSTSGSPVDTAVAQADWNIDTLDGTGPSGITINWSMAQIFIIDFEWLGVGRVRFGFYLDGLPVYCHEILNANALDTVYMTTANLPCRAEIENTGVPASETVMQQYCMSVISEGGVEEDLSYPYAIGRGTATLGVTTRRPVLSIRPRATFNSITNRGHVIFKELEVAAATNHCLWELVRGGDITTGTAPVWTDVDTNNSIVEYDITADTISGGIVVNQGWAFAGLGSAVGKSSAQTIEELFNDFTGTSGEVLSLVCTSFTGTSNVNAMMRWTEQR